MAGPTRLWSRCTLASTSLASISINSAWALPAEAARAVAPGRTIVPQSEAFSFFGSMVSRGLGGIKTPTAWATAGATGTTPAVRKVQRFNPAAVRHRHPLQSDAIGRDPGPGRYRRAGTLTLEGSRSAAEQPDVRHQGRATARGVRDEERLDDRRGTGRTRRFEEPGRTARHTAGSWTHRTRWSSRGRPRRRRASRPRPRRRSGHWSCRSTVLGGGCRWPGLRPRGPQRPSWPVPRAAC